MKVAELKQISYDLEKLVVAALVRGLVGLDVVPKDALSKEGKEIVAGVDYLLKLGHKTPISRGTALSAAVDVGGGDRAALAEYMSAVMKEGGGKEVGAILEAIAEQNTLTEIVNEANRQLAERTFSPTSFAPLLAVKPKDRLVPAGELLVDGQLPPIPSGVPVSLPTLQEVSGGVFGVWVIGGKAKAGKSTLAVQLAVEVSQTVPVIYYDMENGEQVLLYRLGKALGSAQAVKEATKQFYLRRSTKTLEQDLAHVPAPAVIVIDSLQKLPTKMDQRRTGLDHWLGRFEALKAAGYTIMIVSEVNGFGGYKETSEIGYTADFAFQVENHGDYASLLVTENRHRQQTGHICDVERVNDWFFKEADDLGADHRNGGL